MKATMAGVRTSAPVRRAPEPEAPEPEAPGASLQWWALGLGAGRRCQAALARARAGLVRRRAGGPDPASPGAATPGAATPGAASPGAAGLEWWRLPGRARRWVRQPSEARSRPRLRALLSALATAAGLATWSHLAAAHTTYRVERGDTLSAIAARLGVSVDALASANGIADPDVILAGSLIVVPGTGGAPARADYVVQHGDTVDGIASRLGVTRADLMSANAMTDADRLVAGRVLSVRTVAASSGSGTYQVRPGDTLSAIADRVGVPAAALASANGITDPNRIVAGQTLRLAGGWTCPVPGGTFVNDYGYVKPSGAMHGGIDVFAPRGTPVLAPVSGMVTPMPNNLGGNAEVLQGDDGNRYYLAHLDRYGATGRVAAGQAIGYVGNTGDAATTSTHLHLEIRLDRVTQTNPFPTLVQACR